MEKVGSGLAFLVSEQRQGNTDLNGDGDTADDIAHFYDLETGLRLNLGFPVNLQGTDNRRWTGSLWALAVSEAAHGSIDLNGDGDALDHVLHLIRPCEEGTVNVGNGRVHPALHVNGRTGRIELTPGEPICLTLVGSPTGPDEFHYALWVWNGTPIPEEKFPIPDRDNLVGYVVGRLPILGGQGRLPFLCAASSALPQVLCQGVNRIAALPDRGPWQVAGPERMGPRTVAVQALIQDAGSANSFGFSMTNAVVFRIP